jgi:DNA-binding NtrC family response regulator
MNAPPAPPRFPSGTRPRYTRVLVIDDEELLAQMLHRVLSEEFDVTTTSEPAQALDWLASGDWFDVILCDVMMPSMNGVELRNRVDMVRPDLAARIVFMTAGSPWAYRLLETVPNTVIEKPVELEVLRELIRRRSSVPRLRAATTS